MLDFDLLQTNEDTPTLITALVSLLLAFFLSGIVAVTYEFTNNSVDRKPFFLQAMALISIVAATIMLAIGDSLAVGLGMLGALSIIRFRTTIIDPRNMIFIFASLGIVISCGVLAYNVAIVGAVIFCVISILLNYSPWGKIKRILVFFILNTVKIDTL
jgi:hypothetical protein